MGQVVIVQGRQENSSSPAPSLPPPPQMKRDIGRDPAEREAVLERVSGIIESKESKLFDPSERPRMFDVLRLSLARHTNGDTVRALAQHTRGLPEALLDIEGLDCAKVKRLVEKAIAGEELEIQTACRELLTASAREERLRPALIAFWLRSSSSLIAEDLDILFRLAELSERQGGAKSKGDVVEEGPLVDVFRISGVNRQTEETAARFLESDKKEPHPRAHFRGAIELALHRLGFTRAYIQVDREKPNFETRWTVYL